SDAPDIDIRIGGEDLFAQRLRAAVERTIVLTKRKVGSILFREAGAVRSRAAVDASRRDMTPWDVGCFTSLGDYSRENCVSRETLPFVKLACIDVGLSGISRGIYQKLRLIPA